MQANPTITALVQLATLIVALAAVVILGVAHVLSEATVGTLIGAGMAHAGITAYNGATKGAPTPGLPNLPPGRTVTETHTTSTASTDGPSEAGAPDPGTF